MSYKYKPIPEGTDVLFLEVIKEAHWLNRPGETRFCDLPVGAMTWVKKTSFNHEIIDGVTYLKSGAKLEYAITPENNRYCANFDPSCFRVLHTSTQKIKK